MMSLGENVGKIGRETGIPLHIRAPGFIVHHPTASDKLHLPVRHQSTENILPRFILLPPPAPEVRAFDESGARKTLNTVT